MSENDDVEKLRLEFERHLQSLPEAEREVWELQLKHSVTFCTLDGKILFPPKARENLFEVISNQKRFMVDSHFDWKGESAKPEHKDKAFIIGRTVIDEHWSLKRLLFSENVSLENNNLFVLTPASIEWNGERLIALERLDCYYRSGFDEDELAAEAKSLEFHAKMKAGIEHERDMILLLLGKIDDIAKLPPPKNLERMRHALSDYITREAPSCLRQYQKSVFVARHCYALLLAEVRRMRTEFAKLDFNVFNDTRVIQNALFLQAGIISKDKAVIRMARYAGLECFESVP